MCNIVYVNNVAYETVGELRKVLHSELFKEDCYESFPEESHCLCGINIPKTLDNADLYWKYDEMRNFVVLEE